MPGVKVFLTSPFSFGADPSIHQLYHRLLSGVVDNSTMRAAFYMWQDATGQFQPDPLTINTAFRDAIANRRVDAQVLMDMAFPSAIEFFRNTIPARWASGLLHGATYNSVNKKYYLFKGNQYIRHTHDATVDGGYPKVLRNAWSGWPSDWYYGNPDAVGYYEPLQRFYVFKGKEFTRMAADGSADGGPYPLATNWSGWPSSWGDGNLDAAVYVPSSDYWYLFKGNEYARHNHGGALHANYPRPLTEWSAWPSSWGAGGIDAAVWNPDVSSGKMYLFKGEEYLRHTLQAGVDANYPRAILSNWSGWPSTNVRLADNDLVEGGSLAKMGTPHETPGQENNQSPKVHNKTLIFSRVTIGENSWGVPTTMDYVVVEASANLYASQYTQANQAVLVWGDRPFFEEALRRFDNLTHRKIGAPTFATMPDDPIYTIADAAASTIKVYSFPRSPDLIVSILDNIQQNNGSTTGAQLRITMADFATSRMEVADKIVALKSALGSRITVKVALRRDHSDQGVIDRLRGRVDYLGLDNSTSSNLKIHAKYMVFSGQYPLDGTVGFNRLIFCGSHNFTGSALSTNAETWWRIKTSTTNHTAFVNHFDLSLQPFIQQQ